MTATPESPPARPQDSAAVPPAPAQSEVAEPPGPAEDLLPEKLAASAQLASLPPEAWEPLLRVARFATRPLERFLRIQAASGIALIAAAAVALVWANSPWAESYTHLWHTTVGVRLGELSFERSLEWFVNDALMVIFFFVVGMEIRREIHSGELSELRRAALPAIAALGGVAVPAIFYVAIAGMPETRSGWAVPTATDIAFAVGVLTLLGKRVPAALRVLLLALAVIDDLVAILIIAFFYSAGVEASGFLLAALGLGLIFLLQALGVRQPAVYVGPGVVLWAGIYSAGVHPTIAGVIIGLATPVLPWRGVSPAESLIEVLHPWVAYGIMPVFALANAGVSLSGAELDGNSTRVIVAVVVGLVLGKPVGVALATALATRLGIAKLPTGLTKRHVVVLGVTAGIGFTMALFVAQLAFTSPTLLAAAKLGVLCASALAMVGGLVAGRLLLPPLSSPAAAATADEAERSTEQ